VDEVYSNSIDDRNDADDDNNVDDVCILLSVSLGHCDLYAAGIVPIVCIESTIISCCVCFSAFCFVVTH